MELHPEVDASEGFSKPRAAAGALIRDETGKVLMIHPTYKPYWDLPGGYIERGETPSEACRRELNEELGLDVRLGNMLVVDWAPAQNEGDKLLFVFDGGRLTSQQKSVIQLPEDELKEYAYLTLDEIEQRCPARLARRIRQAAQAKTTTYLEHGHPIYRVD